VTQRATAAACNDIETDDDDEDDEDDWISCDGQSTNLNNSLVAFTMYLT